MTPAHPIIDALSTPVLTIRPLGLFFFVLAIVQLCHGCYQLGRERGFREASRVARRASFEAWRRLGEAVARMVEHEADRSQHSRDTGGGSMRHPPMH